MDINSRSSFPVSRFVHLRSLLVGGVLAFLAAMPAGAAFREYRVEFTPSPSARAVGYTLYAGLHSDRYLWSYDIGRPPAQGGTIVYVMKFEESIDFYIALRSYDAYGKVSPVSNEIHLVAVAPRFSAAAPTDPSTTDPGAGGGTTGGGTTGSGTTGGSMTGGAIASEIGLGLTSLGDGILRKVLADGTFTDLTLDSLASKGDLRAVTCDLDGDGDRDLVVGYGYGSGGQIAVIEMENGSVIGVRSIEAGPEAYRANQGMTYPACGDLDGNGRAEIVVGFDGHMQGVVQVFSDMTRGYGPFQSDQTDADGYMQIPLPPSFKGSVHPAIGDIDGDGRGELVVGMDGTRGGYLTILDDASSGFRVHPGNQSAVPWIHVDPFAAAATTASSTFPALGDLDGDGRDEIAVSFGGGSQARVAILNDADDGFFSGGSVPWIVAAGRSDYQLNDGQTRSCLSDIDGDGRAELIVGFRGSGDFELQVFDDLRTGMRPMTTSTSAAGFVTGSVRKAMIDPLAID